MGEEIAAPMSPAGVEITNDEEARVHPRQPRFSSPLT
jgi:hypothetical protein